MGKTHADSQADSKKAPTEDGGAGKSKPGRGLRLDAYLARAGLASRKEARGRIKRGDVEVDGEVARDSARRIVDEEVRLDGVIVVSPVEQTDFVLHKPVGYACSHDEREAPLVFELLDPVLRRRELRLAGRLDRATSGLLVLTTDGDFVHALTHPNRKVAKRYRLEFEGELVSDAVARVKAGLMLGGDEAPTLPAVLELDDSPGTPAVSEEVEAVPRHKATLWLREGRTHQVRRMIRALGGEVVALHRDRIGDFDLPPDLAPGECRPLEPAARPLFLSESSL